ncbi:unnamed protein product [Paramecium octaurelia]|uniref:AB hydrolase-1 domain-containing protein n=1 Tax=Paramecium octaurelia TaxID=43137 RepID=A0A8S1UR72_PAROT|nr:unnamed protein product [Paramecium octaurelia]
MFFDIFIIFLILILLYQVYQYKRPSVKLIYKENEEIRQIIQKCPSLFTYNPTPYLNGFLHTVLSSFKHPTEKHSTNKEHIENTGMSIDWIDRGHGIDKNKPLLFIMPGLTGSVEDGYINTIVSEAHKQHFHNICVYNYRVLQKEGDFTFKPKFYNYGLNMNPQNYDDPYRDYEHFEDDVIQNKRTRVDLPADLHHCLSYLKQKYHFNKILAIGCSYGGAQLGNYLGRFHNIRLVDAACLVCAPHHMLINQKYLSYSMDIALTKILKGKLKECNPKPECYQRYPIECQRVVNRALAATWISDFDANFVIQLYGYKSVKDYYQHFSLANRFPLINIPTLCICTEDDDVCHIKALQENLLQESAKNIICVAKAGGHIGFLEGWKTESIWFPKPAMEYLKQFAEIHFKHH